MSGSRRPRLWRGVLLWAGLGLLWNLLALALLLSGALEGTPVELRRVLYWHLGFVDPLRSSGEWASPGLGILLLAVGTVTAGLAGACFGALVGLLERRRA